MGIVAFIPARSGSKRLPDKNIRPLANHPLIAYTIQAALDSGIFEYVHVSTNSDEYATIADYYGAIVPWLRPDKFARDDSPDAEWIKFTLDSIGKVDKKPDYFAILRPTSPFRTARSIRAAWIDYEYGLWLKMVEPVSQNPYKTWFLIGGRYMYCLDKDMVGKLNGIRNGHALPSQCLPEMYVQTGGLEIRPSANIEPSEYQAFVVNDENALDINTEKDWVYAEWLIANNRASLPVISKPPYRKKDIFDMECGW